MKAVVVVDRPKVAVSDAACVECVIDDVAIPAWLAGVEVVGAHTDVAGGDLLPDGADDVPRFGDVGAADGGFGQRPARQDQRCPRPRFEDKIHVAAAHADGDDLQVFFTVDLFAEAHHRPEIATWRQGRRPLWPVDFDFGPTLGEIRHAIQIAS